MHDPKVSVIVPVYNAERYLSRCIDSILAQTEPDLELILVNDGSSDGSRDICDAYEKRDSRVHVIHKENGGVSRARNDGLSSARGDFIAFADADDYIDPDMYARLLAAQQDTSADMVYCGFRRVFSDHTEDEAFPELTVFRGKQVVTFVEGLLKTKYFGSACRAIYSNKAIGDTRFDPEIRYAEDLLFNLEVLKSAGAVALIPEVLYNYDKTNEDGVCNRTVTDPDFRYTASLQRQLELNKYWNIPLDYNEFFMVYVDMMFQYLVRKLEEGGSKAEVERYLTDGFFAGCCHYDKKIPMRRRIVCILIRKRWFRTAVLVRKLEDAVLKIAGR